MSDSQQHLTQKKIATIRQSLVKRKRSETRFRAYGVVSILCSLSFLVFLLTSVIATGVGAFISSEIELTLRLDKQSHQTSPRSLIRDQLKIEFPDVTSRSERRELYRLVSVESEYILQRKLVEQALSDTSLSVWLPMSDKFNQYRKGSSKVAMSEQELNWYHSLLEQERIRTTFNWRFFSLGDSRNPEVAGIAGAFMGSLFTLLTTMLLSFPIGVGAAIYLEEFAPKNTLTDIIEVNINNLAAVPSIVFGLLGLAIFLHVVELPRSTPLVGGLVLTLMTLPTIIISSRASLKSVPPSIRDGALAMGASRTQVVFHHVVPLALPGMFTGTIIGMAQALGETAPLLMIGMVAFIVDVPQGFLDAATALPVQIFLWSENPERGYVELTSAAIIVLLFFLFLMNGVALYLRRKLETRW